MSLSMRSTRCSSICGKKGTASLGTEGVAIVSSRLVGDTPAGMRKASSCVRRPGRAVGPETRRSPGAERGTGPSATRPGTQGSSGWRACAGDWR
jgi:hypothetical protein